MGREVDGRALASVEVVMRGSFLYEQMDVFRVAVDVARSVRTVPFPRGCTSLRDQAVRSSQSVVLNIAEGRL